MATSTVRSADGTPIVVDEIGAGPALVLIPGQNHGADDTVLAPVLVNFFRPVP